MDRDAEVTYAAERPGDVRHSLADISQAQADLGYEPRIDLREGLTRTVEYYDSRVAA
jgi:nucleoside-diphosphate-sugar epimerase